MASITSFPSKLFAEAPVVPVHSSPSAEEAAMRRPRHGLHLVRRLAGAEVQSASVRDAAMQIDRVVARIEGEVMRRASRDRVRRLFPMASALEDRPLGAA